MPVNPDFRDLFSALNEENVDFLVVGAHAVIHYTEPRYTKDLDVWVSPESTNAERVYRALAKFGAPLEGVGANDFTDETMIYQIGIEPNRIDVIMGVAGVCFADAWKNAVESHYGGEEIKIIGKSDLIKAKKASNRKQDELDVEKLQNN